jgi:hypothetical protein
MLLAEAINLPLRRQRGVLRYLSVWVERLAEAGFHLAILAENQLRRVDAPRSISALSADPHDPVFHGGTHPSQPLRGHEENSRTSISSVRTAPHQERGHDMIDLHLGRHRNDPP